MKTMLAYLIGLLARRSHWQSEETQKMSNYSRKLSFNEAASISLMEKVYGLDVGVTLYSQLA